jgi:hypothetical protein
VYLLCLCSFCVLFIHINIPIYKSAQHRLCKDIAYNLVFDQSFYKVVGNVLAKPMLRTLIYGDINVNKENTETAKTKKIHFDRRIREARVRIEGERMCNFVLNSLKPAALQLCPSQDFKDTQRFERNRHRMGSES